MAYARWETLTAQQKRDVHSTRKKWPPGDFKLFEYWITKDGRASRRGGHHKPTPEYAAAIDRKISGADVRSKGDMRDWKPGHSFSFVRD